MTEYKLQLPSPPENFEGRTRELGKLAQYFFNQHIMIIAGIAGMGKTSMALAFARMINSSDDFSDYNDNVFWIHCEPDWKADAVLQAINRWLLDRGVDSFDEMAKNPETPLENRLQQLVTIIESGNFVVFLDDFHQVEDDSTRLIVRFCKKYLQRGKLIITTRRRVKLSALDRVDILERRLDGLSLVDATALLKHLLLQHDITSVNESCLKQIYDKTRGHPFSIKLFVSLLITGDSTLEELLDGSGEFEEEMARYLMEKNFDVLPPLEKEFLQRFALFRVPVPPQAMASVAPDLETRALRSSLADRYLIDLNAQKLMTMHGIMRSYCLQILTEEQKKKFHHRCAEYFESCDTNPDNLLEAHYHYSETGNSKKALEIATLILEKMEKTGQLQELYDLICKTLDNQSGKLPIFEYHKAEILRIWGQMNESREIFESLKSVKNKDIAVKASIGLAKIFSSEYDYEKALKIYKDSVKKLEKSGDMLVLADAMNRIGIIYTNLNNLDEAMSYLKAAVEICKETGDNNTHAMILSNLGNIYMRLGDYTKALECYKTTLEMSPEKTNSGYATTLYNIALLYFEQGNLGKAQSILDETMEIRQKLRDRKGLAYALNLMGEITYLNEDSESALDLFQQSHRVADDLEDSSAIADILLNAALIHIENADYDRALSDLDESRSLLVNLPQKLSYIICTLLFAEIYSLQKRDELVEEMKALIITTAGEADDEELVYLSKILQDYLEAWLCSRQGGSSSLPDLEDLTRDVKIMRASMRMRLEKHFSRESSEGRYSIITSEGERRAAMKDIERFRARKNDFTLWVDLIDKEVSESTKGKVNILKKRALAPLFLHLLRNAGTEYSSRELFTDVWKRPFDYETDGITIRVNISRLRNLIEPVSGQSQYIKISTNGGKYYFDKNAKFCLICDSELLEGNNS